MNLNKFLFLVFLISGCATAPVNVEIPLKPDIDNKESGYLEKQLGYAGYYFMMINYKFVDDLKNLNRLQKIGTRIANYTEREHIQYKYFIIDSEFRNAFSIPDGYIFVTDGMLKTLKSDEQLATILAHEIAHVTHKHMLDTYKQKRGNKILQALSGKEIVTIATKIGDNKAKELQADQTALCYLYRAGYDPAVFIDVLALTKQIEKEDEEKFKTIERDRDKKSDKTQKFNIISYHPYIENRIVNASSYLLTLKKTEKVQYNPDDFSF